MTLTQLNDSGGSIEVVKFRMVSLPNHTTKVAENRVNAIRNDLVTQQSFTRSIKSCGDLTRGRHLTDTLRDLWVMVLGSS